MAIQLTLRLSLVFAALCVAAAPGCESQTLHHDNAQLYTEHALRDFAAGSEQVDSQVSKPTRHGEVAGVAFDPGTSLNGEDATFLNTLPNLRILVLYDCGIADDFWTALKLDAMELLYVDGTSLSDEACRTIAEMRTLTFISLHKAILSPECRELLEQKLPNVLINDWYY